MLCRILLPSYIKRRPSVGTPAGGKRSAFLTNPAGAPMALDKLPRILIMDTTTTTGQTMTIFPATWIKRAASYFGFKKKAIARLIPTPGPPKRFCSWCSCSMKNWPDIGQEDDPYYKVIEITRPDGRIDIICNNYTCAEEYQYGGERAFGAICGGFGKFVWTR